MGVNDQKAKGKAIAASSTTTQQPTSPSETLSRSVFDVREGLYTDEYEYDYPPTDIENLLRSTSRNERREKSPSRAPGGTSCGANDKISQLIASKIVRAIAILSDDNEAKSESVMESAIPPTIDVPLGGNLSKIVPADYYDGVEGSIRHLEDEMVQRFELLVGDSYDRDNWKRPYDKQRLFRTLGQFQDETNDNISKGVEKILATILDLKNDDKRNKPTEPQIISNLEKGDRRKKPIEHETYFNLNCDIGVIAGLGGEDDDDGDSRRGFNEEHLQYLLNKHEHKIVDRITNTLWKETQLINKRTSEACGNIAKGVGAILGAVSDLKDGNKRLHEENTTLRELNTAMLRSIQANTQAVADLVALAGKSGEAITRFPTTPLGSGGMGLYPQAMRHNEPPAIRGAPNATPGPSSAGQKRRWGEGSHTTGHTKEDRRTVDHVAAPNIDALEASRRYRAPESSDRPRDAKWTRVREGGPQNAAKPPEAAIGYRGRPNSRGAQGASARGHFRQGNAVRGQWRSGRGGYRQWEDSGPPV